MPRTIWLCGLFCVLGCVGTESASKGEGGLVQRSATRFDFESGALGETPSGFMSERTGEGPLGNWIVQPGDGAPLRGQVLAQTNPDPTESRFPLCIAKAVDARDARVSVQFQTRSGEIDQAAGIVLRYRDPDTYYMARVNALERNVRFYRVVGGVRTQLGSATANVAKAWHKLLVEARGSTFRIEYDGTTLLSVEDTTLERAGKAGLWTKADSVTWFDDFTIESLDAAR
ncbi:MAG: hypothetical protein NTY35_06515 [Planctomycetota bacterium]|nr:hypothetical protein [Planctomycetota bacterium]